MGLSHSPSIVTNGLVLCLDAANKRSYPGSGTVWNDLSGNRNNGTLTNGPTFSGANGGSLVFDGTNQYCAIGTINDHKSSTITVSCWYYAHSNTVSGDAANIIGVSDVVNWKNGWSLTYIGGNIVLYFGNGTTYTSIATPLVLNTWAYYCATISSNNTILYKNNIQVNQNTTQTLAYNATNFTRIASLFANFINGKIANTSIYNRILSTQEITQNYNATRGRFI